jgi:tRNA (cytidine32/uridine32-2'-O)-methyltransferase
MIHAVLCHPADPRNVGTCARAVANHGLGSLRVVTEQPFDPTDIHAYSAGAVTRVDYREVPDLDAALAGCHRVIGTSRRRRDDDGPPVWPAAGLRVRLGEVETAILFGTERTGLTTAELDRCQAVVEVPTTELYPSMNLGHAVACIGYELARPDPGAIGPPPTEDPRLPAERRDPVFRHIEAVLQELNYPPGRSPEAFVRRLRRILDRANLNGEELSLVAGVFTELKRLGGLYRSTSNAYSDVPPSGDEYT